MQCSLMMACSHETGKRLIFFYFSSAHLWITKFIQNFREIKINSQEPVKTEDSLLRLINSASLFLGKERTAMLYTVFLAITEKNELETSCSSSLTANFSLI